MFIPICTVVVVSQQAIAQVTAFLTVKVQGDIKTNNYARLHIATKR